MLQLGARIDGRGCLAHEDGAADATVAPEARRWDRFIEATPGGDIVQTTVWAQSKRALGFETCHVIVRSDNRILGGALVVIKRLGPLGAVGYVARGPLVDTGEPAHLPAVLDEIEHAARARGVRHLVIQPPEGGDDISAALAARGYTPDAPAVAPTATMRIDLSQSLEQIFARMSAGKRRAIRCSQGHGVEVRMGSRRDLEVFHALYRATAHRQGFKALSLAYLRHHWEALDPHGWVRLILAYHRGRPLAGVWLSAFGDTATGRLGGWSGHGRRVQPNAACRWHAFQWAKDNGYRYYDLGGIRRDYAERIAALQPLPDEFVRSPAAFKRELGAELVLLPTSSQLTFNPIARILVRSACAVVGRRDSTRRLLHRLRDG